METLHVQIREAKLKLFDFSSKTEMPDVESTYNSSSFSRYILEKTLRYSAQSAQNSKSVDSGGLVTHAFLTAERLSRSTVLDVGGGAGRLFFEIQNFVSTDPAQWDWRILETEELVSTVQAFWPSRPENLHFEVSKSDFAPSDLPGLRSNLVVLFGSSLQYFSNPFLVLENYLGLCPDAVLLLRTPVTTRQELVFGLQRSHLHDNGPQLPKAEMIEIAQSCGVGLKQSEYIRALIPKGQLISTFERFGYKTVFNSSEGRRGIKRFARLALQNLDLIAYRN